MIEYVAGFLFSPDLDRVVLIQKTHPEWQAGKCNGVGGHIGKEDDFTVNAMRREFLEETGVTFTMWNKFAELCAPNKWRVHWFWGIAGDDAEFESVQTTTDESIHLVSVAGILDGSVGVIPNLRWLVPMAINDARCQDSCECFQIVEVMQRNEATT